MKTDAQYISLIEPLERLTSAERKVIERARVRFASDGMSWHFSSGATHRDRIAAIPALTKLSQTLPGMRTAPSLSAWRIWRARERGHKYDVLAAETGSPVRSSLRGRTSASRKVEAIRAVRKVRTFRNNTDPDTFIVCDLIFQ